MAHILLVEDSRFQRNRIREALATEGHRVTDAENGLKGLEQLEQNTFDCIISDLLMDEMDGIAFLCALKAKGVTTPVIIHTADIQDSVRKQCMELGALGFLHKPLNKNALLNLVNSLIGTEGDGVESTPKDLIQLTPYQLDILKEFINIGIGRAASVLTEMLERPLSLQVPQLRVIGLNQPSLDNHPDLANYKTVKSIIELGYKGPISGKGFLVFDQESSVKLIGALMGEEVRVEDLETADVDPILEVGNIVLNSLIGSFSNLLKGTFNYSVPKYHYETFMKILLSQELPPGSTIVLAETQFALEGIEITGENFLLYDLESFQGLLQAMEKADNE